MKLKHFLPLFLITSSAVAATLLPSLNTQTAMSRGLQFPLTSETIIEVVLNEAEQNENELVVTTPQELTRELLFSFALLSFP